MAALTREKETKDLSRDGGVKSARRALEILEFLTRLERPATFAEIEEALDVPRSSLHGLLQTLRRQRWVESRDSRFALGVRTLEAGTSYLRAQTLAERALPFMRQVQSQLDETVQMAILDGTENVYIAKVAGSQPLTLASEVGRRLDAHATGLGKVLLSGLSDVDFTRRYRGKSLRAFTPNTITRSDDLRREVTKVAAAGYAVDNEEYTIGVTCVAVPVRDHTDHVVAAISVSIPTVRASAKRMDAARKLLSHAANGVSVALGHKRR